jgi:DNA-binding LytR/AlgR family response regulator
LNGDGRTDVALSRGPNYTSKIGILYQIDSPNLFSNFNEIPAYDLPEPIKISDIVYGIAQGRYLKIYMLDGSEYFITDKGVSQLYEMLKDMNFARISRSVIINFENVNTIGDEIIMTDGVKLKSSRRMKKQIQEDFFNYMCKVARVERADR